MTDLMDDYDRTTDDAVQDWDELESYDWTYPPSWIDWWAGHE